MNDIESRFIYIPANLSLEKLPLYVLDGGKRIMICDCTMYGGGYSAGMDNGDGTFMAHISTPSLKEAMQTCIELEAKIPGSKVRSVKDKA